jgi:hypothetical protein
MPTLSTRIDALEKHAPDFRQQFMHDLMQYVSIQRVDDALKGGLPGLRTLLVEAYWKKAEKSGSDAADAWVLRLKQNLPR